MATKLTYTGELIVTSCWCGISLAIPSTLYREAKDGTQKVYCPLGHTFVYNGGTIAEAEERIRRAEAQAARERARRDQAEAEAREERRRTEAARAETNRTRQRLAGGACPCCNRTFTNLARHMNGQHPDYIGFEDVPDDFGWWGRGDAVVEIVGRAGEPLTAPQVFGRLILAGRRSDTLANVKAALYNAQRAGRLDRVAKGTWTAAT